MQTSAFQQQRLPLGIDLGNYSTKVAALGRTGTQVLPNALSNRETPTLVSLASGRRLVGEAATTQRTSNVSGTVWNIRALLGRVCTAAADGGALAAVDGLQQLGQPCAAWQAFDVAPTADGGLAVRAEASTVLPLEAVAAACLGDCVATAQLAAQQGLVRDGLPLVALAAPAWGFTASQRAAVTSAAAIAGIDTVGVLSEPAAAALFYHAERLGGLLRELQGDVGREQQSGDGSVDGGDVRTEEDGFGGSADDEVVLPDGDDEGADDPSPAAVRPDDVDELTTATVIFVDIGHGGTSASLIAFDSMERTIQVLGMAGVDVGGREIDVLLAERFQQVAEDTQPGLQLNLLPGSKDARVARARQRIFAATDESKKVLSANESDTAMLEELAEGVDVRCSTTREDLQEMLTASGVLDSMMVPIQQVLQRAAAAGIVVDALELYGGTSRVPMIASRVHSLVDDNTETPPLIRRSLNGAEAVARGCALFAAMALPTFNESRRVLLTETTAYDISVVLTAPPPPAAVAKGEASKLIDPEVTSKSPGQHLNRGDTVRHVKNVDHTVDKAVLNVARGSPLPSPISGSPSVRLRLSDVNVGSAVLNLFYTDSSQLPQPVSFAEIDNDKHASTATDTLTSFASYRLEIVDGDLMSKGVSEEFAADDETMAETRELLASEAEYGFVLGPDLSVTCLQRSGPACELVALKTAVLGVMSPTGARPAMPAPQTIHIRRKHS